uniref:Uncharacterized protein n=1 Tax=Alexandrium andersonii TaxID=327968 RepID=A0A7S2N080_9DINO
MAMIRGCSVGLRVLTALLALAGTQGSPQNATAPHAKQNATGPVAVRAGNSSHAPGLLRGATAGSSAVAGGAAGATANATAQAAAGTCSADDAAIMEKLGPGHAVGSFPDILTTCGKRSWSLFGGFSTRNFLSCLRTGTTLSVPCSECFGPAAVYAYDNCKFTCLFGSWCGQRCIDCVMPTRDSVNRCTGVSIPLVTVC